MRRSFLQQCAEPALAAVASSLRVFYHTVVQATRVSGSQIVQLQAVQRTARANVSCGGWDVLLSDQIEDWYSPNDSARFTKQVLIFAAPSHASAPIIFMDATSFGDVLATADVPYLQGTAINAEPLLASVAGAADVTPTNGDGYDVCGQAIALDFTETVVPAGTAPEPPNPFPDTYAPFYSLDGFTWTQVFTYRRLVANNAPSLTGQTTLQNWGTGNDNMFGYLFLSQNDSRAQVQAGRWAGGINVTTLSVSEGTSSVLLLL